MRSALDAVLAALATLQTELKAAGARSAACTRLESEAADWEAFLGGGPPTAAEACRAVRADVETSNSASLSAFVSHLRESAGALKATVR